MNAVALAGIQGEKALVAKLAEQIKKGSTLTDACCMSLSMIGKDGALALLSLLRPGDERTNREVLSALGECSDNEVVKALRHMSQDARYAKERKYFMGAMRIAGGRMNDRRQDKKDKH